MSKNSLSQSKITQVLEWAYEKAVKGLLGTIAHMRGYV